MFACATKMKMRAVCVCVFFTSVYPEIATKTMATTGITPVLPNIYDLGAAVGAQHYGCDHAAPGLPYDSLHCSSDTPNLYHPPITTL